MRKPKFVLCVLCLLVFSCGTAGAAEIVIRVASALAESHATHVALTDIFAKQCAEKSGGRLKVEVYPNSQLGGDRQAIEGVSMGTIQACQAATAVLANFDERFIVFDLPFLFKSAQGFYDSVDNELEAKMNEFLEIHDILVLGTLDGGLRHVASTKRPIAAPADMKGMKIRTMENPIHMATFKAFGANPTPMAMGELYTALQQGAIDAIENSVPVIETSKFYEVTKYYSLTGHLFTVVPLMINKPFFDGLAEDLQQIILEAGLETEKFQRDLFNQQTADYMGKLEAAGMTITPISDENRQLFVDLCRPIYDDFTAKHGTQLLEIIEKYNK